MKYALGCAFKIQEVLENFPYKKLKITCNECEKAIGNRHRLVLVLKVFKTAYKLVINDIINRNVMFELPVHGKVSAWLHMRRFKDWQFKALRKAGKWADVDILKSNFSAYLIALYMYGNKITRVKPVYLNPELTKKITDNTNKGMNYGDSALNTNVNTYLDTLCYYFPEVPKEDLLKIMKFGWKSLYLHNSYGGDTLIWDYDIWSYMGYLQKDPLKHFEYYKKKLSLRIRLLHKRRDVLWDGYYYFALTNKLYEDFMALHNSKGKKRKMFNYGTVMMYEILDDCKITESNNCYIFKVKYPSYIKLRFLVNDFKSDLAELIITRQPLTFNDILVTNNKYELL